MVQFSIREFLILTVTAGLAVGWVVDSRARTIAAAEQREAALELLERHQSLLRICEFQRHDIQQMRMATWESLR